MIYEVYAEGQKMIYGAFKKDEAMIFMKATQLMYPKLKIKMKERKR